METLFAIARHRNITLSEADKILLSSEAWSDIRKETKKIRGVVEKLIERCPDTTSEDSQDK